MFVQIGIPLLTLILFCHAIPPPVLRPINAGFNNNGSITGTILPGYRNPYIEAFLGIPFAEPPVGDLRFADPVPIADFWSRDHTANEERMFCVQKNYFLLEPLSGGVEDCLYLNIYRPLGTTFDNLLPVLIYIHGGGLFAGSPSATLYGPKYFMDRGDVILVTIAYRLGPFGFLSTGDIEMSGNQGLKDQALAMKWIKDYIFVFNGDANRITIMGQSSGAASVHLHMLSPMSQDLFHRAIINSGSAISPIAYVINDPLAQTRLLAKQLNITNYDTLTTAEITAVLRTIDPIQLVEAGSIFRLWSIDPIVIFRPVIESVDNPNAFLIENPLVSMANGNVKNIPILMVLVPEDGVVRSGPVLTNTSLTEGVNNNFDTILGLQNLFDQDDPEIQTKVDRVVDFYLNGTRNIGWDNAQQYTDMFTDRLFYNPYFATYKLYTRAVDTTLNPVYLLEFNYLGPFSFSWAYTGTFINFGVVHSDELIYLFDTAIFPLFDLASVEAALITEMVDIFVNFVSDRVPHEKSVPCTFDESDPDRPCEYLHISNSDDGPGYEIESTDRFDLYMVRFWREIDPIF